MPPEAFHAKEEWSGWFPALRTNIVEHVHPPAALGVGQRDLLGKAKAIVSTWALQTKPSESLSKFADSIVSHTSDMGVEMSLPDLHISSVESLLPAWRDRRSFQADVDDAGPPVGQPAAPAPGLPSSGEEGDGPILDSPCHEPEGLPAPGQPGQHLFTQSITVAGLQHTIDNLTLDVHKALGAWPDFYRQLEHFEALLRGNSGDRRRLYVWTCLRESVYAAREPAFDRFSATLYEGRWREVVNFIRKLQPLLFVLSATWDHNKFLRGGGVTSGDAAAPDGPQGPTQAHARQERQEASSFDPAVTATALRGSFFSHYCQMTLLIEEVPVRLAQWAEGCSCHSCLYDVLSLYKITRVIRNHFGRESSTCPMAGKRAPELVTGKLAAVAEQVWAAQASELHRMPIHPGAAPLSLGWASRS